MLPRNRRVIVPRYGGSDVMTVIEEPLPEPGPGPPLIFPNLKLNGMRRPRCRRQRRP
jgi:hypothetical protein